MYFARASFFCIFGDISSRGWSEGGQAGPEGGQAGPERGQRVVRGPEEWFSLIFIEFH